MGGQKCSALSRLYVHESVAPELVKRLREKVATLVVGDPAKKETYIGPVTPAKGYEDYARYAKQLREGGSPGAVRRRAAHRGTRSAPGSSWRPRWPSRRSDHALWHEEMFLPILMMHRVKSNEEAMRSRTPPRSGSRPGFYGSADEVQWFFDQIEAGVLYANRPQGATTGAWPGYQPFGGWKGSGSTGKAIASFYYLAQYLREQSQTLVE